MNRGKDAWGAIESGDTEAFREAIAAEPDLAHARDENGISIVLQAVYHRRVDMVNVLLTHRPELDIFESAALGAAEPLKQLLGHDPGLVHALSPDGFTPLHLASFFGDPDCVRILIECGAEVSRTASNPMSVTPLNSAAARGRLEIARLLLEHGANVEAAQKGGITSLHSAAHNGDEAMVELLLAHGADPQRGAEDGRRAADFAREKGHGMLARRLEQNT